MYVLLAAHLVVAAVAGTIGYLVVVGRVGGLKRPQGSRDLLSGLFLQLLIWPIICSFFAGILVIIWQCLQWLEFAFWPEMTIQMATYYVTGRPIFLRTGWLGIDQIFQWLIGSVPLALWLVVILPLMWLGAAIWVDKRLSLIRHFRAERER
jgi:hypothetical protein